MKKNLRKAGIMLLLSCGVIAVHGQDNHDYTPDGGGWNKFSHKGGVFKEHRYSDDENATNTYKYEIGTPGEWSFIPGSTSYSGGETLGESTASYAGIQKVTEADKEPESFTLAMSGTLTKESSGSGNGTRPAWNAEAKSQFFYIKPLELIVPFNSTTTKSFTASGSSSIDLTSDWTASPTWSATTTEPKLKKYEPIKKKTSISVGKSGDWNPPAGKYTVTATTVNNDPNTSANANLYVVDLDLDIDSNNTNGYGGPDRGDEEDSIEDDQGKPGKILTLNNLDINADGVPNFASGYDISFGNKNQDGTNKSAVFVPIVLEVKGIDADDFKIKLTYSASDPAGVTRSGDGSGINPYSYNLPSGNLRIWTKNGNNSRKKASVNDEGDFVPSGELITFSSLSPNNNGVTTLYVEAIRASSKMGDLRILAELYDSDGEQIGDLEDAVRVTVVKVSKITPNKTTKVIIKTRSEDKTYPDKEHQDKDQQIKIKATITPELENVPIYFEVIDPDDLSPYEGKKIVNNTTTGSVDKKPNDNRDPSRKVNGTIASYNTFQGGLSSHEAKTNNKGQVEVYLTITNRYSGDNYIVRATCCNPNSSPFDSNSAAKIVPTNQNSNNNGVVQSGLLVAWKRAYIEKANMYKKGATVTTASTASDNTLIVDNVGDFSTAGANSKVTIFLPPNGTKTISRTITAINSATNTLTFNGQHCMVIPEYSGVRIDGENAVYTNNRGYFNMAYGSNTDGSDGGTFIEYKTVLSTPNLVPKYTSFPNDATMFELAYAWFINKEKDNLYQLLAAKYHSDSSFGTADPVTRQSVVTVDAFHVFPATNRVQCQKDTTSHETGHIWGLRGGSLNSNKHIDNRYNRKSHCNNDRCIMSYDRNRTDDVPEFCLDCIYSIRDTKQF